MTNVKIAEKLRNTSTYVEKTVCSILFHRFAEKHLHVCGENVFFYRYLFFAIETPPRMWRKLNNPNEKEVITGNTSTYVEKTKFFRTSRQTY